MRKKSQTVLSSMWGLVVLGCFTATAGHAAIVNLTFTEDINSFTSTWVISDNGGGDFSGAESVIGSFWQVGFTAASSSSLQDTVGHILGPHGEVFGASSFDHGILPTTYFTDASFVVHGDGHRDDFSFSSDFIAGEYQVSFAGRHSVPVPAAFWLFGSGLSLLGWQRKKKYNR
jgi:hypothetical protein